MSETIVPDPVFVRACDGLELIESLPNDSVRLILTDPPFYGIVEDEWDNQWTSETAFVAWLTERFFAALPKLTLDGSLIFFAGIGKHGCHPVFDVLKKCEMGGYTFRHWVTWKKRRAYGKECDYLFTREEIIWLSRSPVRTQIVFHKPYTTEIRGYDGFNPRYRAKSQYKRVGSVWTDVPQVWDEDDGSVVDDVTELFKPERHCQKPPKLMARILETHTTPDDLVVDPFAGWGTTIVEAVKLGRRALGSEIIVADALAANERALVPWRSRRIVGAPSESQDT